MTHGTESYADALNHVNTYSSPSDLRITDLRIATVVGAPMRCPLLKISTNQGIEGYGEVRDGASGRYALMLKSRVLGENPCNVDKIFRIDRKYKSTGTAGETGTGLGLVLCRDFVEKNGGKIWCKTREGSGSSFHFTLPGSKIV